MDWSVTSGEHSPVSSPVQPSPLSYLLVGPADLLHDLSLDFLDIGWEVSVVRWQAVVTAPPEDAGSPEPEWPTEVTRMGIRRDGHAAACAEFLSGDAGMP
jgi:hypothetical protein